MLHGNSVGPGSSPLFLKIPKCSTGPISLVDNCITTPAKKRNEFLPMNAIDVAEWMDPLLRMCIILITNSPGTVVA